jgi:hypothetical protein
MTANQIRNGRQACSVISCGQEIVNGGVPVDRLIESERVKYAATAKFVAKNIYGGGLIFCCDDCKTKLAHCKLEWSKITKTQRSKT